MVKARLIDDDRGNPYLSMRNEKGVRRLIPISHLMAYFLRSIDKDGAIEDDRGFDERDVSQMRWYVFDDDAQNQDQL